MSQTSIKSIEGRQVRKSLHGSEAETMPKVLKGARFHHLKKVTCGGERSPERHHCGYRKSTCTSQTLLAVYGNADEMVVFGFEFELSQLHGLRVVVRWSSDQTIKPLEWVFVALNNIKFNTIVFALEKRPTIPFKCNCVGRIRGNLLWLEVSALTPKKQTTYVEVGCGYPPNKLSMASPVKIFPCDNVEKVRFQNSMNEMVTRREYKERLDEARAKFEPDFDFKADANLSKHANFLSAVKDGKMEANKDNEALIQEFPIPAVLCALITAITFGHEHLVRFLLACSKVTKKHFSHDIWIFTWLSKHATAKEIFHWYTDFPSEEHAKRFLRAIDHFPWVRVRAILTHFLQIPALKPRVRLQRLSIIVWMNEKGISEFERQLRNDREFIRSLVLGRPKFKAQHFHALTSLPDDLILTFKIDFSSFKSLRGRPKNILMTISRAAEAATTCF